MTEDGKGTFNVRHCTALPFLFNLLSMSEKIECINWSPFNVLQLLVLIFFKCASDENVRK